MRVTIELFGHVLDLTYGPAALDDSSDADLGSVDVQTELAGQDADEQHLQAALRHARIGFAT